MCEMKKSQLRTFFSDNFNLQNMNVLKAKQEI